MSGISEANIKEELPLVGVEASQQNNDTRPVNHNFHHYECLLCQDQFHGEDLNSHLFSYHSYSWLQNCNACARGFLTEKLLLKHNMLIHLKGKVGLRCKFCGRTFNHRRDRYTKNVYTHTGERPFKCQKCEGAYRCRLALYRHMLLHTGQYHQCTLCQKTFSNESGLSKHKKTHREEYTHECDICGKKFSKLFTLSKHKRTHSIGIPDDNLKSKDFEKDTEVYFEKDKPFHCKLCHKAYKSEGNLISHMAIHSMIKTEKCNTCGKYFATINYLSKHILTHKTENEMTCGICGKSYKSEKTLSAHVKRHTTRHVFQCDKCDQSFTTHLGSSRHLLIHTNGKVLKCSVCSAVFIQRSHLKIHLLKHTKEKPFKCNVCQKGFSQKGNLGTHLKIHAQERPFKCKLCSKDFVQKNNYFKHMKSHES